MVKVMRYSWGANLVGMFSYILIFAFDSSKKKKKKSMVKVVRDSDTLSKKLYV